MLGANMGSGGTVRDDGWDWAVEDSFFYELFKGFQFVDIVDVPLGLFADLLLFNLAGWQGYVG